MPLWFCLGLGIILWFLRTKINSPGLTLGVFIGEMTVDLADENTTILMAHPSRNG